MYSIGFKMFEVNVYIMLYARSKSILDLLILYRPIFTGMSNCTGDYLCSRVWPRV